MLSGLEREGTIGPTTGDFHGRDHETVVAMINATVRQMVDRLPEDEIERQKQELQWGIDNLHHSVTTPAALSKTLLIAARYQDSEADLLGTSHEERMVRRIASGIGLDIVSDLDGTITKSPTDWYLRRFIPASDVAEDILKDRREAFIDTFVRTWQPVLREGPELFRQGAADVPVRKGVQRFIEDWQRKGSNFEVLSANFGPFARGVMHRIVGDRMIEIRAVEHDDVTSTAKADQLISIAHERPQRSLIFLGDGSSDLPAIQAGHILAGVFALEGSTFAAQLQESKVPFLTYRDFDEINVKLTRLKEMGQQSSAA